MTATQAAFLHPSKVALAAALGCHRNTVTAYLRQRKSGTCDCPGDLDELQWRLWLAGRGEPPQRMPEGRLLEMLARAGVPAYVAELQRVQGQAPAVADAAAAPSPSQRTMAPIRPPQPGAAATSEEIDKHNKALRSFLDLEEKWEARQRERRQLVHVEQLGPLVDALAALAAAAFDRLPAIAEQLTQAPEDQARLRTLLQARAKDVREQLAKGARAELRRFLDEAPAAAHA